MKIILLAQAKSDIRQAVNYIRKDNPSAAESLITALQASLHLIERNPHVGRPDLGNGTREWSVPNWPYVIPYRVKAEVVEILRIWHTRRDKPETWS